MVDRRRPEERKGKVWKRRAEETRGNKIGEDDRWRKGGEKGRGANGRRRQKMSGEETQEKTKAGKRAEDRSRGDS